MNVSRAMMAGIGAYLIWGGSPIYWNAIKAIPLPLDAGGSWAQFVQSSEIWSVLCWMVVDGICVHVYNPVAVRLIWRRLGMNLEVDGWRHPVWMWPHYGRLRLQSAWEWRWRVRWLGSPKRREPCWRKPVGDACELACHLRIPLVLLL